MTQITGYFLKYVKNLQYLKTVQSYHVMMDIIYRNILTFRFLGFGLSVEFHMVYILCGHWRTKEGGSNIVYKLCVTTGLTMATQTGLYQFNISSYLSMLLV